jgi:hypothetical protein
MAEMTEVYDALRKADAAGDVEGAKRLTEYIQSQGAPKQDTVKEEKPKAEPKAKSDPFGFLKESQDKYKTSFAGRLAETFDPIKAITQEGIVPQLAGAAKRAITGEKAPKAEEAPEQSASVRQTLSNMVKYAKQDPGAFAGTVANAIVADPELLLMPEFIPAKVLASIQKVSKLGGAVAKTADAATQAAAMAAGQSAARQLNERGTIDMDVLKQDVKNAAVIGGGTRVVGEAGRAAIPGAAKYASAGSKEAIDIAKKEGYTIPLKEMSPLGAVLDKYYKTPLEKINSERFAKDITSPTGTQVSEINTTTLPKIEQNLSTEINGILANEKVTVPAPMVDKVVEGLKTLPQTDVVENAIASIENGVEISGKTWHKIRSELTTRKFKAVQSDNHLVADNIDLLINRWDQVGQMQGNFTAKATTDFNIWKKKYTAYADIREGIASTNAGMDKYLEGKLSPADVMNGIRKRREKEALLQTYTGRPQTKTAAIASGLDLLGEKGPVTTSLWGATIPKLALSVPAKGIQAFGYTKPGQNLFYKGIPETGIAPYVGYQAGEMTKEK